MIALLLALLMTTGHAKPVPYGPHHDPPDVGLFSRCDTLPDYTERCAWCHAQDKKIVPHDDDWYAMMEEDYPCAGLVELQCHKCGYRWLAWGNP